MTRSDLEALLLSAQRRDTKAKQSKRAMDRYRAADQWADFGRAVASIPDCVDRLMPEETPDAKES